MKFSHLSLLFLALPRPLLAGPYPMVKELKTEILADGAIYRFTQHLVEVPDSETNVIIPGGWEAGLMHRHAVADKPLTAAMGLSHYQTHIPTTLGKAALEAWNNGASSITQIRHIGPNNVPECVGYGVKKIGRPLWSEVKMPIGACVETMPGKEWCKLLSPSLLLDHKTVKLTDDQPATSGEVRVECSSGTKARLSLSGSPLGTLDIGGGKSTLYGPNGQLDSSGGVITIPGGESSINIVSKLNDVQPGTWVASGVLIIEPM